MDSAASTVMLIGGGEGMGKLEETAEALAQMSGPSSACIVV
jgi:1,2-diacylglycerol 3-beta-galactosyltransferase